MNPYTPSVLITVVRLLMSVFLGGCQSNFTTWPTVTEADNVRAKPACDSVLILTAMPLKREEEAQVIDQG